MFEAQLLNSPGGSLVEVYSPWFPREGDLGRFTLEVVFFTFHRGVVERQDGHAAEPAGAGGRPAGPEDDVVRTRGGDGKRPSCAV